MNAHSKSFQVSRRALLRGGGALTVAFALSGPADRVLAQAVAGAAVGHAAQIFLDLPDLAADRPFVQIEHEWIERGEPSRGSTHVHAGSRIAAVTLERDLHPPLAQPAAQRARNGLLTVVALLLAAVAGLLLWQIRSG